VPCSASEHPLFSLAKTEFSRCSTKELRSLFLYGIGVHNAGMVRQDRLLVEKFFTKGVLRVKRTSATDSILSTKSPFC
jgi:replicative superfamily II helicase